MSQPWYDGCTITSCYRVPTAHTLWRDGGSGSRTVLECRPNIEGGVIIKIVSWNIGRMKEPWHQLLNMDVDLAFLQEATPPPPDVAGRVEVNPDPWEILGGYTFPQRWRTAIVRLSDRVKMDWIESKSIADARLDELAVSIPGTMAAAWITPLQGEPFFAVSMYSQWRRPYKPAGTG